MIRVTHVIGIISFLRFAPGISSRVMGLLQRYQVVDIQLLRAAEGSTCEGTKPTSRGHFAALACLETNRLKRLINEHLVSGVPAVAVLVNPMAVCLAVVLLAGLSGDAEGMEKKEGTEQQVCEKDASSHVYDLPAHVAI